jgi:hypothetical protein
MLLESRYPVYQIWNANQDDISNDELIDLDSGGAQLAVYRPFYDVYVRELDPATYAFLAALQQGASLESALSSTAESDATATVAEIFAFCIQEGLFAGIIGELRS